MSESVGKEAKRDLGSLENGLRRRNRQGRKAGMMSFRSPLAGGCMGVNSYVRVLSGVWQGMKEGGVGDNLS